MVLHRRLFFILLALLPTQLGWHFWPTWAYILGRKVDYLSPTVFLTDILIFSVLIAWAVISLPRNYNVKRANLPFQVVLLIFAITIFIVVNIWFASNPAVAIYKWVKLLEFAALGLYVMRVRPSRILVAGALSVGVLYSSWLAMFQFVHQGSIGGVFWLLGERTFAFDTPGIARFDFCSPLAEACSLLLRPYGTFPHPNVLGGFLATVLPIVMYMLFPHVTGRKHIVITMYYWFVLMSGCIALVLTLSRSAWIIAALGFMAVIAVAQKKILPAVMIGIFAFGLITLGFMFQPSATDESVVRRILLNNAAINIWQRSPFIGVGLGNFLVELPSDDVGRQVNFLQPVHNMYLLLLSEAGFIGFLISLPVIFLIKSSTSLYSRFIYVVPLCGMLLIGLVDHYPMTLQQGQVWFVLLIALTIAGENR